MENVLGSTIGIIVASPPNATDEHEKDETE
jgi:hypothetical protein